MRRLFPSFLFFLILFPALSTAQSVSEVVRQQLIEQGNVEYQGNTVRLLPSAQEKFDAMFQSISSAQRYVHLEYFSLRNDSIGNALLALLGEKAKEGVEVRLLIDGYGNRKNVHPWTKQQVDSLTSVGVKTAIFDPIKFPWINHAYHRDHRKIVVVDGQEVFTGGMNVADYYIHGTERTGVWRDMHVSIQGSVVDAFEQIFAHIWEKETKEHLDSVQYHSEPKVLGDKLVTVVNREPGAKSRCMRESYRAAIDAAQHEICIVNPYPTNVWMVRRALKRAVKRGVRVRIMVSANSDVPLTPDVIGIEMKKMMKSGCEVYYYEGGFHHSKLMMVDGEFFTVGTANLDGRSMRYDYEVNVYVFDNDKTAELKRIFDEDLLNSQRLTKDYFRTRFSLKHRLAGRIFWPVKCLF